MKTYYVYELVNQQGEIEYIGKTCNPHERLIEHRKSRSKFTARHDLQMKLVKEFNSNKQALKFEGKHKIANGFEWTERIRSIKGGIKGGAIAKQTGQIYELAKENIENGTLELARQSSRESCRKEVLAYEYKTNKFIGKFDSMVDASKKLNVGTGHICNVCKGNLKQIKGYTFKYV